jgi:putative endonuclease
LHSRDPRSRMPSEALAKEGSPVRYVYLLASETFEDRRYVGVTSDLKQRLAEHNAGESSHTSKYLPWKLVTYVAFSDGQKADAFERYLKSGSGHAFARKRLW